MGIALLCVAKLKQNLRRDISAVNQEKNKFEEVLEKAKIKRDELEGRTADRRAKELKKEAEEAAARDLNRTPGPSLKAMRHWN